MHGAALLERRHGPQPMAGVGLGLVEGHPVSSSKQSVLITPLVLSCSELLAQACKAVPHPEEQPGPNL